MMVDPLSYGPEDVERVVKAKFQKARPDLAGSKGSDYVYSDSDVKRLSDEYRGEGVSDVTREETIQRLSASEARVGTAIAEMRTENAKFLSEFSALRGDMATFRSDVAAAHSAMKSDIAGVRTDHAKEAVIATRWQVGLIFAILLAAFGGIATTVLRTSPRQVPTQATPIIITVPASPAPAVNTPVQPATPLKESERPAQQEPRR